MMATRMSVEGVSPPTQFLAEQEKPPTPWKTWKTVFENYMLAIRGDTFSDARQRILPLHCIGSGARRVYESLPVEIKQEGESAYNFTLRRLSGFYEPKVNVIMERYNLRQRFQGESESTVHYVDALRGLAVLYNFEDITDELIRYLVVERTIHPVPCKKSLQDTRLTLDKVLSQAEAYESAAETPAL